MQRVWTALRCARLGRGFGGVFRRVACGSVPRSFTAPVVGRDALPAAASPLAWRGFASSGAFCNVTTLTVHADVPGLRTGAQGPPAVAGVAVASLRQQLADVAAQLRAVDADIRAARAAGNAQEVSALREKEKLLMEKEKLLMEKENLLLLERSQLHGPSGALQPGACPFLSFPGAYR
jgi:hypothetical protein